MNWIAIIAIGAGVGFLSGMFGKGGSAVATPLLHAVGVPAIIAVAAPLPATIPSTLAASLAYWKERLVDESLVRTSVVYGLGATVVGAIVSQWVGGGALIVLTDVVVVGLGLRSLLSGHAPDDAPNEAVVAAIGVPDDGEPMVDGLGATATLVRPATIRSSDTTIDRPEWVAAAVAVAVGFAAGLLANSGGFLLAPLYIAVLRLPVKKAFASSLMVSAALAVPGTIVHAALGHIDWTLVAVFALSSVPLSYLGAKVAIRTPSEPLERVYGAGLTVIGLVALLWLR